MYYLQAGFIPGRDKGSHGRWGTAIKREIKGGMGEMQDVAVERKTCRRDTSGLGRE